MATIDLSDDQLQGVVSTAIMQAIGDKQRDLLVGEAIRGLLEKGQKSGIYGYGTTPIQEAFNLAVEGVARDMAREMLVNDEAIKAQVKALISDVLAQVFEVKREQMVTKMVSAFVNAMGDG